MKNYRLPGYKKKWNLKNKYLAAYRISLEIYLVHFEPLYIRGCRLKPGH